MANITENMNGKLSPEIKLVLLCSKLEITGNNLQAIESLLAGPIDWQLFLELTEHHRVYPLAYRCLSTLGHSVVPTEIVSALRQKSRHTTSKCLQMTGELVKVLRAMEQKGVRGVVLKGIPLATMLYGDLTLRASRDLDILVWPEDMEKAAKIIEAHGYHRMHPSFEVTPARLRNWMRKDHHVEYWHKEREICLELHWRLGHHSLEIPLNHIERKLTKVNIAGQQVYTFGAEELLLYLVLHGASHAWFRLRWLCDIGVMLRQESFSWKKLYVLAERLGTETLLNQAIILAQQLLEAPVPDNISEVVRKDRKAQKLAGMALPFISTINYDSASLKISMPLYYYKHRYDFTLQSGWKQKIAFMHGLLSPADRDIESVALPDYLYFIYYLLRPFSWFSRRVSELAGR